MAEQGPAPTVPEGTPDTDLPGVELTRRVAQEIGEVFHEPLGPSERFNREVGHKFYGENVPIPLRALNRALIEGGGALLDLALTRIPEAALRTSTVTVSQVMQGFGVDRATAERLRRDLNILGQSAFAVAGTHTPAGRPQPAMTNVPRGQRMSLAEFQERLRAEKKDTEAAAPAETPAPTQPAVPQPPTPRPEAPEFVTTPRGNKIGVKSEVAEAGDLIVSHTDDLTPNPRFPQELQPRERDRAASQAQVQEIAGNLRPELLGRSPTADTGSPIIGPDRIVESGNARTLAIRRAYRDNPERAEAYREYLRSQGYDLSGFKEPVLVRRRTTELGPNERRAFVEEANQRTTLAQSATETAKTDARNLSDDLIAGYQGGDINSAANRPFVRSFVEKMSPAERGSVLAPDGSLSQDGIRRIQNALFERAYQAPDLLAKLRETTDTSIAGIGSALMDAAPAWAKLRAKIGSGTVAREMDITRNVVEAAQIVENARRTGTKLSDRLKQSDMFGAGVKPETAATLRLFFRDDGLTKPRNARDVADALRLYVEQASQRQAGPGLLPGTEAKPLDVLNLVRQRLEGGLLPAAADMRPAVQSQLGQLPAVAAMAPPGSKYLGMRPQTYDPAVKPTGKPIRREEILADLMHRLNSALYEGRIQGKQTLGFYRRKIEEVRAKKANDIEVAAHEIAHMIDDRYSEVRQQWLPASKANATIRSELAGISYDASKLYEGFAEFVRHWMTNKTEAQARVPNFAAWWEGFVGRTEELKGPLLDAQKQMHDWFAQAALDRARSKIGMSQEINDGQATIPARFRQSILDDLHGIARMERELTGHTNPLGAYETARLVRGKSAVVEGAMLHGAPKVLADGSHVFTGKGLKQILDPLAKAGELDDFLMYAVGRSSRELKNQGRENLFSNAEIKAMLDLDRPSFQKAFEEYQRWNEAVLDFAEKKGVINPYTRMNWKRTEYLPFHRVSEHVGGYQRVPGAWSGVKALKGGTENIRPVLQNVIQNAATLIDAALVNEARLKVADLGQLKGGAKFLAEIPKEEYFGKVRTSEVQRVLLEALGVKYRNQLTIEQQMVFDDIFRALGPITEFLMPRDPSGPNVVAVLRDGKPSYYEVADPILFRSLTALNRPATHPMVQLLSIPRRIGQLTITMAPDFMAANFVRDSLMGFTMSRHGFKPFIDSARGFRSRLAADQNYRDFIANGGGISSIYLDEGNYRVNLERFYTKKGIDYQTVLDSPKKLALALERFSENFEMATRLGEYIKAREAGQHPRHAAYLGREISTDFAARGDSKTAGFFYDTVIFLKAGVVSMDRLYRGFANDPNAGVIAAKTAGIALASIGLHAINRTLDSYDALEDWDRDTHWHFFIPKPGASPDAPEKDRYLHFRLPKIWEIGAVSSISERWLDGILNGQPKEAALKTLQVLGNLLHYEYLPQLFAPLYEVGANRDRFRDRPIETQAMRDMEPWARSSANTSRSFRALGEVTRNLPESMQIPPAKAEHLFRGYLNTIGMYGLSLTDAMLFDDKPETRLDQYPVIRRFFSQQPATHTRHVTELYEMIQEATEARRTMRHMAKSWRPQFADEMEKKDENAYYRQLTRADRRMRVFSNEMRAVLDAPDLAAVRKEAEDRARAINNQKVVVNAKLSGAWNEAAKLRRMLLDDIAEERNRYAKEVMDDVRRQRKERSAQPQPTMSTP